MISQRSDRWTSSLYSWGYSWGSSDLRVPVLNICSAGTWCNNLAIWAKLIMVIDELWLESHGARTTYGVKELNSSSLTSSSCNYLCVDLLYDDITMLFNVCKLMPTMKIFHVFYSVFFDTPWSRERGSLMTTVPCTLCGLCLFIEETYESPIFHLFNWKKIFLTHIITNASNWTSHGYSSAYINCW